MLFYLNPILNWVVPLRGPALAPARSATPPTLRQVATRGAARALARLLPARGAGGRPAAGLPRPRPSAASVAVLGGMGLLFRRILAREVIDPASASHTVR